MDMPLRGDGYDLPLGEPSTPIGFRPQISSTSYIQHSVEEEEEVADAPLSRAVRTRKSIPLDDIVELRKQVLVDWMGHYASNKRLAQRTNLMHKIPRQAKKNADRWITGVGLFGLGGGIGKDHHPSLLAVFSGSSLFEMINDTEETEEAQVD